MEEKKYTNRRVDKVSVDKSKELMWKHIQSKTQEKAHADESGFGNFIKSLFTMPKRLATVGAVAMVLLIAVLAYNLNFSLPFLKVETVHADFTMEAEDEDAGGVESHSTFTLRASENLPEGVIKESLKVEPEVEFEVNRTGNGEYEIEPVEELQDGKIYRFYIESDNETFSWAYQIKDTFKVLNTIPGNQATIVPLTTGIEINFSHENFDIDDVEKHFEISPKVSGYFEKHQRTAVFVPDKDLIEQSIYTVTLKSGMPLADSDQKLSEDYVFQFETDKFTQDYGYSNFSFVQTYYELGLDQTPAFDIYYWADGEEVESFDVSVYQMAGADDYLDILKTYGGLPEWCYYAKENYRVATEDLKLVGNFEGVRDEYNYTNYLYLPEITLEAGYYVVEVDYNGKIEQAFVQVTDLSSYLNVAQDEILVWVNDLETGKAANGAKVEVVGGGESANTNAEGIARFETPEEFVVDYQDRAVQTLKITSGDKILFNQLIPYKESYSSTEYWKSFGTDRPVYQTNDTIKFWGFIKPKQGSTEVDVSMKLINGWNTFVSDVSVKMEGGNTYSGQIDIKNLAPGYYTLEIYDGEKRVDMQYLDIRSYVKPAYNLTVEPEKRAVFGGEELNFEISTNFFDGTPVPNLDLEYYDQYSEDYTEIKSDVSGKASLSFTADQDNCNFAQNDYCYDLENFYLSVNSKLAEETDIWAYSDVRVFNSRLSLDGEGTNEGGKGLVEIKTHEIDLNKINSGEEENYYDYLGEVAPGEQISGEIRELWWEKIETGEYYDFINKKKVPTYEYIQHENTVDNFTVETDKAGEASYQFPVKEDRYYKVLLQGQDSEGYFAHDTVYVYGSDSRAGDYDYHHIKILNGKETEMPELWWSFSAKTFDIGEEVQTVVANNEVPLTEDSEGQFLFMQHANGLEDYVIQDSPAYNFEFANEDVPSVYISAIWFDGESYKTINGDKAYYDKELKRLNLEFETDKEEYNPGDEVTLKVKVTDQDGDGAKAKVNLNLVDEAYYKAVYDNFIDPLEQIYAANSPGILDAYDTHNSPLAEADLTGDKGGCFTAETQILMADGTYKSISEIKAGDKVLTKAHEWSAELVEAEVKDTVSHFVGEYLVINDDLEVTAVHVVFVNGAWDVAGNIKPGDRLLNKDGEEVVVNTIRKVNGPVWVYNFEVEGYHTYLANDFYVHNDKGGDTVRSDFEDNALFETIETNGNGQGEITFKLPDNITSWRVTGKAIDTDQLQAGAGTASVKVSLPFFVDLIMNSEYSINDKPLVKFRAYGEELAEGDEVEFQLESESLGLAKTDTVAVPAYEGGYQELPELKIGKQNVTIYGNSGGNSDALKKEFEVVGSRLSEAKIEFDKNVTTTTEFALSDDQSTVVRFVDGGVGFHYADLLGLFYTDGDRLDQRLSKVVANELLKQYFHEERFVAEDYLAENYQKDGGLVLLPYADPDLRLTALAAAFDPNANDHYDVATMTDYFYDVYMNSEANLEEIVWSLLGLASLDEPVLLSLRALEDEEKLTLENKLYIALAFQNLGSKEEANAIYEEVFEQFADGDDSAKATALGAILAAGLEHDEEAALLWEFVERTGFKDDLSNLYELGYIANSVEYANVRPVSFTVKVGDSEEKVDLEKWQMFEVMVAPGEELKVLEMSGELAAVSFYDQLADPEDLAVDGNLSIERSYYVNGKEINQFTEGDLIEVRIDVTADIESDSLYWKHFRVVDILPSGLKLATSTISPNTYFYDDGRSYPYNVDGQEISFYWSAAPDSPSRTIKYFARVVAPGEYYADPAKVESYYEPAIMNISEEEMVQINSVTN